MPRRRRFLARWHVPGDTMYSRPLRRHRRRDHRPVGALFLGVNYQCISCHGGKGFLEKVNLDLVSKKRRDFWAMAAFFGKTRVRVVPFQDRFTITEDGTGYDTKGRSSVRLQREGGEIQPTFMLTGEKADPSKPLRPQFARMLTTHPQFARATVNLIWKQFFGLGIVDPVDSFDMARQDPKPRRPRRGRSSRRTPRCSMRWREISRHTVQPEAPDADDRAVERLSALVALRRRVEGELHPVLRPPLRQAADGRAAARRDLAGHARLRQLQAQGLVYGTPIAPVRFWTEAATPEEIGDGEAKSFLRTFGQANREQFDRQPADRSSRR